MSKSGESFESAQARVLLELYNQYLFFDSAGKSYTLMRKRKVVSYLGESTLAIGDTVDIREVCGEKKSWTVKVAKVDRLYGFITYDCEVDIRSHEPDLHIETEGQTFYQGGISRGVPCFQRGRIITSDLMKSNFMGSINGDIAGAEGCGLFYDRGIRLLGICVSIAKDSSGEYINRFVPIGLCARQ